ncbi:GntR family transcriptional regulator [Sneathia sp. DSM 16631]|uniref:GntR family transcriptional regulator n=1 Tax=Sneathia TaxID=168808 RepID=UPI001865E59B|nr:MULTISPECIES: GntR family transcriptional regulator [Sneathia]MBE3031470.1 GntR family transcriptional regulator [Sneathia sp. DSM 16631]MDK9581560.1 GntR family transcriptional regulator [Sneathia vaginalis]
MAEKLYEKILNELIEELKYFKVDSHFYSERSLASYKNISKLTARKIISILVEEGYLYKKNNIGTFVKKTPNRNIVSFAFFDSTNTFKLIYLNLSYSIEESIFNDYKNSERYMFITSKNKNIMSIEEVLLSPDPENEKLRNVFKDINRENLEILKEFKIQQTIEAVITPVKFSRFLNVKLNTPIVLITNKVYDGKTNLCAVIKSYLNPNNNKITIY